MAIGPTMAKGLTKAKAFLATDDNVALSEEAAALSRFRELASFLSRLFSACRDSDRDSGMMSAMAARLKRWTRTTNMMAEIGVPVAETMAEQRDGPIAMPTKRRPAEVWSV